MAEGFDVRNMKWNMPEFQRIRNSEGITRQLHARGQDWVKRLNAELHQEQAQDNEPEEDGYTYQITHGSRSRLYVYPYTARAMAHEARDQSMLKNLSMGEIVHEGVVDPNLPAELAKRVRRHKAIQKRRAKKWLKAEALHRAANLSPEERAAIVKRINEQGHGG